MKMKSLTLDLNRPAEYLNRELRDTNDSAWQQDRVYFPHCHRRIQDRVRELANFPAGWDGANAEPIDPKVIDAACNFFDRLAEHGCGELLIKPNTEAECLVPHCVPLVSGGVQLEWHVADRILELEFESVDNIRYLKWWPGHDLTDEEASYSATDFERSADLIRWVFYGDDDSAP